jgi:hypothetical protein
LIKSEKKQLKRLEKHLEMTIFPLCETAKKMLGAREVVPLEV